MSADAVVTTLKSMKLHGMAGAVAELAEQGSPAYRQSRELLDTLAAHGGTSFVPVDDWSALRDARRTVESAPAVRAADALLERHSTPYILCPLSAIDDDDEDDDDYDDDEAVVVVVIVAVLVAVPVLVVPVAEVVILLAVHAMVDRNVRLARRHVGER